MNDLLILSRAIHFGSCLVLLSIFAVRLLVERPRADESGSPRKLAALCLALAACSGFLWFWAAAAGMNGSSLKASLNADCDGQAGLQQLAGDATLLFYLTEEGKEGKNAFLEKRKPNFKKFRRLP